LGHKKSHRRGGRYLNFLVVPHPAARVSSFKVPVWFVKALAVLSITLGIVGIIASVYFINAYNKLLHESRELDVVRKVNRIQEKKIGELEKKAELVEAKIQEINELDRQVRQLVGLKNRETVSSRAESGPRGGMPFSSVTAEADGDLQDEVSAFLMDSASGGDTMNGDAADDPPGDLNRLDDLEKKLNALDEHLEEEKEDLLELREDVKERLAYLRAYPNHWPARGRITSTFGWRRSPFGKGREFHDGLDIANGYGTPIRAAGEGRVISTGWKSGYGRMVVVNHGYGYVTYYAHCSKILVKAGEWVKKGEIIARIGTTGRTTGPHVHFSVTYRGRLIDPLKVLK